MKRGLRRHACAARQRALSLIELLTVVAVAAILLTLAAPSFRDLILMQRLKGINALIVTDMQLARSEAASRGLPVTVRVGASSSGTWSCYMMFTDTAVAVSAACDCLQPEATRCAAATAQEIRTVIVPTSQEVGISTPAGQPLRFAFDPFNGSTHFADVDGAPPPATPFVIQATIDTARALGTVVSVAGRPSVCAPSGSTMPEAACP
jgi:prepilin-type N-terminal cleavage/methylation domain-containing protein